MPPISSITQFVRPLVQNKNRYDTSSAKLSATFLQQSHAENPVFDTQTELEERLFRCYKSAKLQLSREQRIAKHSNTLTYVVAL
jgi:hypothetical protein